MQIIRKALFLGNPFFLEDKIALVIGEILKGILEEKGFHVIITSRASLGVIDYFIDADEVVVVDSLLASGCARGEVTEVSLEDLKSSPVSGSHTLSLGDVITLATRMPGSRLKRVRVIGICISDNKTMSQKLPGDLEAKLDEIAKKVLELIIQKSV